MPYKVTATRLNVRNKPEATGIVLKTLAERDVVEVKEIINGWGKIKEGYVSMRFLEEIRTSLTLAERALTIARSQLGVQEEPHGSNWGKQIEKYLKSVGITFPASWCMAFVYWCVNEACKEMKIENPLYMTGGVMMQVIKRRVMIVKTPQKGDIFLMDFGGGKGHTGFVDAVRGDRIETIEGNSNDEGSREGVEVCRKPNGRKISSCVGFLRL